MLPEPLVVKVAVEKAAYHFDKPYSYFVPETMRQVRCGCRVMVPFGGGNRRCQGIVIERDVKTDFRKLKPVFAILDDSPLFSEEQLKLAAWIKEHAFCSLFEAAHAMLPPGMYLKIRPRYRSVLPRSQKEWERLNLSEQAILRQLDGAPDGVYADKLMNIPGQDTPQDVAEGLVKKGLAARCDAAVRLHGDASVRMVRLTLTGEELHEAIQVRGCTDKQRRALDLLEEAGAASVKELCYFASVTAAVVTALQKKGLVEFFDAERLRSPVSGEVEPLPPAVLDNQQREIFESLCRLSDSSSPRAALLYGVTGSGKTQVYMNLIDHVLASGKQAMALVPEIALTPQMMRLFLGRYGKRVALLHSGLSIGERMDEWKRVNRGEADIVLGTRSAVFAPLKHIGLIVMDEEQEHTYKSESPPRFHTRDVVRWRCAYHNALMLLCSATPSLESYYRALNGRYRLFTLPERYGQTRLPKVRLVDMRANPPADGVLTAPLVDALSDCFSKGKQAILLYNRRGYHTFVSCKACGTVITCPSCSISMTYHAANHSFLCHYCGRVMEPVRVCPSCGGETLYYSGAGTQKVEEALKALFPHISVLRMDADTTLSRFAYEKRFSAFANGEYPLMLGTQMVAKGLDFPNVALVGVLCADMSLFADDYRSFETTFSLLTQVIGRAGRRDGEGLAVIQTYSPDNEIIQKAAMQDYEGFYRDEIAARKAMAYPPYTDLVLFGFAGLLEAEVRRGAEILMTILKKLIYEEYAELKVIVLNPAPATVARVAGKYRYKLLMKTRNTERLRKMVGQALISYYRNPISKRVSVYADVNPSAIL